MGNSYLGARIGALLLHRLDRLTLRVTGDRRTLSSTLSGVPTVQITTVGAKSGRTRTVLVVGLSHPDGLSVIASNFGQARHPSWYYNLKANPVAIVSVHSETWTAVARVATPIERVEIWARALEISPAWKNYQATAGTREIQAFILARQG